MGDDNKIIPGLDFSTAAIHAVNDGRAGGASVNNLPGWQRVIANLDLSGIDFSRLGQSSGTTQPAAPTITRQPSINGSATTGTRLAPKQATAPRTPDYTTGFTAGNNIVDLAEVGALGRRGLRQRGFSYQDPTTGEIVQVEAGELSRGDMRRLARTARQQERLARRYGLGDMTGWSQDAINLRRQQVGDDRRYTTLAAPEAQPAATPEIPTFNYNLEGVDEAWGDSTKNLLSALYENKQYDLLKQLAGDAGTITYDSLKNWQLGLGTGDEFKSGHFGNDSLAALVAGKYLTQEQANRLINGLPQGAPTTPSATTPSAAPDLGSLTDEQLADKVLAGAFGNGTARRQALGDRYSAVQGIVNQRLNGAGGRATTTTTTTTPASGERGAAQTAAATSGWTGNPPAVGSGAASRYMDMARAMVAAGQKHGGKLTRMKYFQQGGSVAAQQVAQEQAQEQQARLNEMFMALAKNPKETLMALQKQGVQPKQVIELAQKMADKNPAAKEALAALSQMSQMTPAAKQGTKLEYIKRLRGECPEGYEARTYKIGGKVCKKCEKIEAEKCGGKAKKHENGGEAELVTEFKNRKKN